MSPKEGLILSGRYELRRRIARGSMSDVFEAHDLQLGRRVAIKILAPSLSGDPKFIRRFRHEAQAAAKLSHPNIVSVYDQGSDGIVYYIVMEFLEGRSLSAFLKERKRLDPAAVVGMALNIATALKFAHEHGVIHRDVKPGNILIASEGQVRVVDFGIAYAISADTALTKTGAVLGTVSYFSPEQASGKKVDARSDLYSLGIVLYEILAGVLPFSGDSPVAIAYKHVQDPPPPLPADIPATLSDIVMKLLEKQPENRFQSGEELIVALKQSGKNLRAARVAGPPNSGPPNSSPPNSSPKRSWFRPRNPQFRAILWSLFTAALAGLILTGVYFVAFTESNPSEVRVEVVSVYGSPEPTAVMELEDKGLVVAVERAVNIQIAKGLVYEQDPRPGAKLPPGDIVTIFISEGGDLLSVPEVIGHDFIDAERLLVSFEYGFQVQQEFVAHVELPGVIVRQEPLPGEKLAPGERITLFVSMGIERIPDLRNRSLEDAQSLLEGLGYLVNLFEAPDVQVPAGAVIRTSPAVGLPIPDPKEITLYISTGRPIFDELELPSVIGFDDIVSRFELEDIGFTVEVLYRNAVPGEERGVVVEQQPPAGTIVPGESFVRLIVTRVVDGQNPSFN